MYKIIEIGDVAFIIRCQVDEDPDLSSLGTYTNHPTDVYIDRMNGTLIGPNQQVLCGNLHSHYKHGQCRYFVPGSHLPHDPKNWEHVPEEDKAAAIAQFGSLENADIHYAIMDYEHMEEYGYSWNAVGVIVEIHKRGVQLTQTSVWGVNSNHWKETAMDLAIEVIYQIPDEIARLEHQIAELKTIVLDENTVLTAMRSTL
jgi:hypothetical protein